MAATDQTYRNQLQLDTWFAVSCLLMLGSIIWMFAQDYFVPFKPEQRVFRDVESEVALRLALEQIPPSFADDHDKALKAVEVARTALKEGKQGEIDKIRGEIHDLQPKKEKADAKFQNIKSYLESRTSFFNLAVDNGKTDLANHYQEILKDYTEQLKVAKAEKDALVFQIRELQNTMLDLEKPLNLAIAEMTKQASKLDTFARVSIKKQWGLGDSFRALPIIDGFASPYKIHQFVINDIPIDYNFKYVTRFDRCVTCHQGIANPDYDRERLASLRDEVPQTLQDKLTSVQKVLEKRREALAGLPDDLKKIPPPGSLRLKQLPASWLTDARVAEFAAHPNLDLYVGPKSKHPAEKFGCSSCHQGQGSATAFVHASHSPNDSDTQKRWSTEHHWHPEHMWDFPMLPSRFIESSCLKCHHQVTDLIDSDNRNTAPKVVRGFNLIKENGCFGCHEIQGRKGGRSVGPDLRLEPYPPRDDLTTPEVVKLDADPDTAPGYLRKVGPSLFRIREKTNEDWTARWIKAPRDFRPETKMPHFYGLSNNDKSALPESQKDFPDAEVQAMTHYLFKTSKDYLDKVAAAHKKDAKSGDDPLRKVHAPLKLDATPLPGDSERGRFLFTIKGCLACHSHHSVEKEAGTPGTDSFFPKIVSEAQFGPDLSQLAGKLGAQGMDKAKSAQNWLVQWIKDPHIHSPRSRMPVTHMSDQEAADIAAWLLAQNPDSQYGPDWKSLTVATPNEDLLRRLAKVYLVRLIPEKNIEELEKGGGLNDLLKNSLPEDEQTLVNEKALAKGNEEKLKMYVGKKAISRQGCFGCHDIPGFEKSKSIGVGLIDWGKKDPERLAFDNINHYVSSHYKPVDRLTDKEGKPYPITMENGKKLIPYEKFYYDSLTKLRHREGYLNQKILNPRSYDYGRDRAWDDRARMPEFRFARSRKRAKEDDAAYEARQVVEEAEAREAVATFVLGLVADPVPLKSVNLPTGDRMAEVKGRQIIDKYNCGGCHQIRPGVFDFKLTDDVKKQLARALDNNKGSWDSDHLFPYHKNWVGKNPKSNFITVQGVNPRPEADRKKKDQINLKITMTQALAIPTDQGFQSIRASKNPLYLPQSGLIYPTKQVAADEYKLKAFLRDQGPLGGSFAELLETFLKDRDEGKTTPIYKWDFAGFSAEGRHSGPPLLIGQGERTQEAWLYNFLLNPEHIRPMTEIEFKAAKVENDKVVDPGYRAILRMPKFNMSPDEAKGLVQYFTAVERLTNSGTALPAVDQIFSSEADKSILKDRTKGYIDRLKTNKIDPTFANRKKDLEPLWAEIAKESSNSFSAGKTILDSALKAKVKADEELDKAMKAKIKADEEVSNAKKEDLEAAQKAKLKAEDDLYQAQEKQIAANNVYNRWDGEVERLKTIAGNNQVKNQEAAWLDREAYPVDALPIVSSTICMQCHQVGNNKVTNSVRGPALNKVHDRLRPGWVEHWLAKPERMMYYTAMPDNFPANKMPFKHFAPILGPDGKEDFSRSSYAQVLAARDILLLYPQATALPVNQKWLLPDLPGGKK